MDRSQLSRDFSGRVQINFHRKGDSFRFRMWMAAFLVGCAAAIWLIWNSAFGGPEIYHAGSLSVSHKMLERRCDACHRPFQGPLERLTSLGRNTAATSAPDDKCLACHEGAGHFFSGSPELTYQERTQTSHLAAGHEQHCADCHREHGGKQDLTRIAGAFCTTCHSDLKSFTDRSEKIDLLTFQNAGSKGIHTFADHPEFAVHEIRRTPESGSFPPSHGVHVVMGHLQRKEEQQPRWQDKSVIRFNHAKHLGPKDPRGLPDARGVFHDLSNDCGSCHQPDAERRSMEPVNFEMHCRSCHPLVFDAEKVRDKGGDLFTIDWDDRFPGKGKLRNQGNPDDIRDISELTMAESPFELLVVPHQNPSEVRGFLADIYAMGVLKQVQEESAVRKPIPQVRPLPGHANAAADSSAPPSEQLAEAEQQIRSAESLLKSAVFANSSHQDVPNLFRALHWLQSSGGCGFCHEQDVDPNGAWRITKPNIPDKWFLHARFDHDAHRALKCVECHSARENGADTLISSTEMPNIYESSSSGDVLIPQIAVCRNCHAEVRDERAVSGGARADCLECHSYHQRGFEGQGKKSVREFLQTETGSEAGHQ